MSQVTVGRRQAREEAIGMPRAPARRCRTLLLMKAKITIAPRNPEMPVDCVVSKLLTLFGAVERQLSGGKLLCGVESSGSLSN